MPMIQRVAVVALIVAALFAYGWELYGSFRDGEHHRPRATVPMDVAGRRGVSPR